MKYEKEFKKWVKESVWASDYDIDHEDIRTVLEGAWRACGEFYELRKCEDCEYYKNNSICPITDFKEAHKKFSCKIWKAKKGI